MNSVAFMGRLTKKPEVRYSSNSTAVAKFTIAVDRPKKDGEEQPADFIRITVFGHQAETCEKFLDKGRRVIVLGRLQTGSYENKNGDTVYTTDVIASRVEIIDFGSKEDGEPKEEPAEAGESFEAVDEDVPF